MIIQRGINMFMIVMILSLLFDLFLGYSVVESTSCEKNKTQLPPGPEGIPLLGYYPFLQEDPVKKMSELGKEYGNIFGLNIGPQYTVVLNDWEALKDGLSQSVDRPITVFSETPYDFGIARDNGPEWKESRELMLRIMKEVGLYSSKKMKIVQEETRHLVQQVMMCDGQPVKIREFILESITNTVVRLLLCKKLEHGNSITEGIIKGTGAINKYNPALAMKNYSPTLSEILQLICREKKSPLPEETADFQEFVSNTVDETIKECGTKNEDSFICLYNEEIENRKSPYITVDSLKGAVTVLLVGATEKISNSLVWALLTMADYPDLQQKVQEELDGVIGKEGSFTWADRFKIPYTYATMMESMRYFTLVPILPLRVTSEDMYMQGYFIPNGSFITANMWAIHNDPEYWDAPEKFNPERFLEDDCTKVNTHPESFAPFSYGPRGCPAKLFANMEILQYFTILTQNFKILPKEGDKVKYGTNLGAIQIPTNVELRFIKRQ